MKVYALYTRDLYEQDQEERDVKVHRGVYSRLEFAVEAGNQFIAEFLKENPHYTDMITLPSKELKDGSLRITTRPNDGQKYITHGIELEVRPMEVIK